MQKIWIMQTHKHCLNTLQWLPLSLLYFLSDFWLLGQSEHLAVQEERKEVTLQSTETRLMSERDRSEVRGQRQHSPKARQKSRKAWWGWTLQDCSLSRGGTRRAPARDQEEDEEEEETGRGGGEGGTAEEAEQDTGSGRRKWRKRDKHKSVLRIRGGQQIQKRHAGKQTKQTTARSHFTPKSKEKLYFVFLYFVKNKWHYNTIFFLMISKWNIQSSTWRRKKYRSHKLRICFFS